MKHRWLFFGLAAAAALPLSLLVWLGTGGGKVGDEPGTDPATTSVTRPGAELARVPASERTAARVASGTTKLAGRLKDKRTGEPFAGATVVLERRAGPTDIAGTLARFEPGSDTLTPAFPLQRRVVLGTNTLQPFLTGALTIQAAGAQAEAGVESEAAAQPPPPQDQAAGETKASLGFLTAPRVILLGGESLTLTLPQVDEGAASGSEPPTEEGAGATSTGSGSAAGSSDASAAAGLGFEEGSGEQVGDGAATANPTPVAQFQFFMIADRTLADRIEAGTFRATLNGESARLKFALQGDSATKSLVEVLEASRSQLEVRRQLTQFPGFVERGVFACAEPLVELARAVTDEDGRFELDCPETDDCVLRVVEETPYCYEPATRPVGRVALACGNEFEWETLRVRREPFEARVVDARTHEPVPFLTLRVRGDDRHEDVRETDEHGRLRTPVRFRSGSLALEFLDAEEAPVEGVKRSHEFLADDPESAPAELAVRIGPTLRFSPRLGSAEEAGGLLVRIVGVRWKGSKQPVEPAWHSIRTQGGGYWMRFPAAVTYDEDARVELVTADGLLAGSDALAGEPASDVNPRAIRFVLRASCAGVVAGDESAPQAGARVRILDADGNELAATTSGDDGSFQFLGLDARGARTIEVSHPNFGTSREPIHLGAGRLEQLAPTLPGSRPAPNEHDHRDW